MSQSISNVITQIQADILANVAGVRAAPDAPPESLGNVFPFVVCYPTSGTVDMIPLGATTTLIDIVIELHVARRDLPRDYRKSVDYGITIPSRLYTALGDGIYTGLNTWDVIEMTFGALVWDDPDRPNIGWRFTLRSVKLINEL